MRFAQFAKNALTGGDVTAISKKGLDLSYRLGHKPGNRRTGG
jgi:hypothetical protein